MGTPTQIYVFAKEFNSGFKSTKFTKEVGPNQKAGRGQNKDVTNCIMLLLIKLVRLNVTVKFAKPIAIKPNGLQSSRVVPLDKFRTHHSGIRPIQLFNKNSQRIGGKNHVIVHHQEKAAVTFDEAQGSICRWPKSGVGAKLINMRLREIRGPESGLNNLVDERKLVSIRPGQ